MEFSSTRQAPEHVLEGLRRIDPKAELLWWGPRLAEVTGPLGKSALLIVPVWLLGTVQRNYYRHRTGAELMHSQEVLGARGNRDTWRYANLLYQGFAPVEFYPIWGTPHEGVVRDFQKRDWVYRHQFEQEGERVLDAAEGLPKLALAQQTVLDKVQGEAPDVWRFTFGGRRSVHYN